MDATTNAVVIKGIRTNYLTGKKREVAVTVALTNRESGTCYTIIDGGVTGHESWYLDGLLASRAKRGEDAPLGACVGGGGWDELVIPGDEFTRSLRELGAIA